MKKSMFYIFIGFIMVACQNPGEERRPVALTPPMGWNSWNCFGFEVNEQQIKLTADYMAEHMKQHGWEYVVVDMGWYYPSEMIANDGLRKNPPHSIDQWGRLVPDTIKFPSAAGGNGFKALADYVHSKGLKFGIHIMRGIPWDAVQNNLPIKETAFTASDIALMADTCEWNKSMKGVDVTHEAGKAWYNSLFELYAQWGVDYIKVDDIARTYHAGDIEAIHEAIDKNGRPMILSLSPGPAPLEQASHLKQHANMWRISNDFWDSWDLFLRQMDYCRQWYPHISAGHWPDIDMLPLGKLRKTGADEWVASLINDRYENIADEYTRFTRDEQVSLMNLMAIFKSPLMMGGYLPENDNWTLRLLTNEGMLKVNQHSVNNREIAFGEGWSVWAAEDPASGEVYMALFNLSDERMEMDIPFEKAGVTSASSATDIWTGEAVSVSEKLLLQPHASALISIEL